MNITLDGSIKSVDFNGTDVDKVTFNGTVVWEKQAPAPAELHLVQFTEWDESWELNDGEAFFFFNFAEEIETEDLPQHMDNPGTKNAYVVYNRNVVDTNLKFSIVSYDADGNIISTLDVSPSTIVSQLGKNKTFYYFKYV